MANAKCRCRYTEPSFSIQSNKVSTTNVTFVPEALEYVRDCFLELSDFTFAHSKERFSNADKHLVCILLQNRCTYRLRFCDFTQRASDSVTFEGKTPRQNESITSDFIFIKLPA